MLTDSRLRSIPLRVTVPLAFLALIVGSVLLSGCHRPQPADKIRISVPSVGLSAPLFVASDQGYFVKEGLEVAFQPTLTGTDALQMVIEGKADMAACTETPVMLATMEGRKVSIFATISDSETTDAIAARKDRGISHPEDLEGKTIGVPPLMNLEYFLDTFLLDHGIPRTKIRIVRLKVDELAQAIKGGKVDAVCVWDRQLTELHKEAADYTLFYSLGTYRLTWHMVATQDFVRSHPDLVSKVLRALVKARGLIVEHRDTAFRITADHLRIDQTVLANSWKGYNFNVTLSQSVLVSLQDQARWLMRKKGTDKTRIPDFSNVFYLKALKSIDPTLVTIGD